MVEPVSGPEEHKITAVLSKGAKRFRDFHLNRAKKEADRNGNGDPLFKGSTKPSPYPRAPKGYPDNPTLKDPEFPSTYVEGYKVIDETFTDEEAEELFYHLVENDPGFVAFIKEWMNAAPR